MKYRIVTNGKTYRIQCKNWYSPWWGYVVSCLGPPLSFRSLEEAKNWISEENWKVLREE